MVAKLQKGMAPEKPRYKADDGLDLRSTKKLPCDWLLIGRKNDMTLNGPWVHNEPLIALKEKQQVCKLLE